MNQIQMQYLEQYLNSLPDDQKQKYTLFSADYFCADKENADICADLVRRGTKTATCSMKYWYEQAGEAMPVVGQLQVVTDWDGHPTSIIETLSVSECLYSAVTAEFAAAEGEGDLSLEWWRKEHWAFFSRECEEERIQPSEDMVLILECFQVVFS